MLEFIPAHIIALILFITMVATTWFGYYFASVRRKKGELLAEGGESLEGALLGLVALLLAFTFSMSASRYDARRGDIVTEANAIGTAVLRADLYPDSIRSAFRGDFKDYVEARITYYEAGTDTASVMKAMDNGNAIAMKIWKRATELGRDPKYTVSTMQMVPALNDMIDIVTTRFATTTSKVPPSILWLLLLLCVVAGFVVGYGRKNLDWVIIIGFSLMTSLAIYLIIDLDRPRRGLINMDNANKHIVALREMFSE